MLKKILNNHFFQGSFLVTVSTFFVSLLNYGFNLLMARGLSLSDYGELISVLSYIILLTIPFGAFGTILVKRIGAVDPSERRHYATSVERWLYGNVLRATPLLLIVGGMGYWLLNANSNLKMTSVIFILIMALCTLLLNIYFYSLQAYKEFLIYGVYLTVIALFRFLGGAAIIHIQGGLTFVYILAVVLTLCQIIWGHFLIRKKHPQKTLNIQFQKVTTYLRRKSILIPALATFGILGLANVDVILVKKLMTGSEAGLYGAVTLLAKIIFYVTSPILSVGYIFFTGQEHKHQAESLLLIIAGLVLAAGLAAIGFYTLFSSFVIHLFFDQRFNALQSILWLSGVYGTLYSIVTVFSNYFISKNSFFSTLPLLALAFQVIAIYFFHSSLAQVLLVNNALLGTLLFIYIIAFSRFARPT